MSELSRDDIVAHVHPIDDATVAEIIATGANNDEFKQACVFVSREKKTHGHHDLPPGRAGKVAEILERVGIAVRGAPFGEAGSKLE